MPRPSATSLSTPASTRCSIGPASCCTTRHLRSAARVLRASARQSRPNLRHAFARLMTRLFAAHSLIVMDAAGRDFHALGASTLRFAIEHAEELEAALLVRTAELEAAGCHAQVLVKPASSLLFLVSEVEGAQNRQALHPCPTEAGRPEQETRRPPMRPPSCCNSRCGARTAQPQRAPPPVFQDTILPTTAYIGGPAEVAYFAQSAVLYQRILGRITPILPRLSATLVEPAIGAIMAQHEVSLPTRCAPPKNSPNSSQRAPCPSRPSAAWPTRARADHALAAAHDYFAALDPSLARSAEVSASKMRYQMGRLRRLAATFELHREASLRKHARPSRCTSSPTRTRRSACWPASGSSPRGSPPW